MLTEKLKDFNVILASGSPRRHAYFKTMNLNFEIRIKPVEEVYPNYLKEAAITDYLAKLKAEPFLNELKPNDILVTSDTIVWLNEKALGKPKDERDAFYMIKMLSGTTHKVVTSICFTQQTNQQLVHTTTNVTFRSLTDEEIWYYIKTYQPMDKAGAYGIQEWLGAIGITAIEGSYNNVVGLPTHLLYETLNAIAEGA